MDYVEYFALNVLNYTILIKRERSTFDLWCHSPPSWHKREVGRSVRREITWAVQWAASWKRPKMWHFVNSSQQSSSTNHYQARLVQITVEISPNFILQATRRHIMPIMSKRNCPNVLTSSILLIFPIYFIHQSTFKITKPFGRVGFLCRPHWDQRYRDKTHFDHGLVYSPAQLTENRLALRERSTYSV